MTVYTLTPAQMARDYVPRYPVGYQPRDYAAVSLTGPHGPVPEHVADAAPAPTPPTRRRLDQLAQNQQLANAARRAAARQRVRDLSAQIAAAPRAAGQRGRPVAADGIGPRAVAVLASDPGRTWSSREIAARLPGRAAEPARITANLVRYLKRGEVERTRGALEYRYQLTEKGRQLYAEGA